MPLYDYRCPKGHEFEAESTVADRAHSMCECGESADKVILTAPNLDNYRMGRDPAFASAYAKAGKDYERRAQGLDMGGPNRYVTEEATLRKGYTRRVERGNGSITTNG